MSTMHHCERYGARSRLGRELEARGWKVTHQKEDQSDTMTDYWSPADWYGWAESPCGRWLAFTDYSGFRLSNNHPSQDEAMRGGLSDRECELIRGSLSSRQNWGVIDRKSDDPRGPIVLTMGAGLYARNRSEDYREQVAGGALRVLSRIMRAVEGAAEAPDRSPLRTEDVEVTQNEMQDGVEVRFGAKPPEAVREALKAHKFRWSRRQKLWYARRTPERVRFAESLVEGVKS